MGTPQKIDVDTTDSMASAIQYEKARKRDMVRMGLFGKRSGTTEPVVMWMWGDLNSLQARNPLVWSNPKDASVVKADMEQVKERDKNRPVVIRVLGAHQTHRRWPPSQRPS